MKAIKIIVLLFITFFVGIPMSMSALDSSVAVNSLYASEYNYDSESLVSENSRIDMHQHLFNAKYLFKEVVSLTWDMLCHNYPHKDIPELNLVIDAGAFNISTEHYEAEIDSFVPYVVSMLGVLLRDPAQGYDYIQDSFSKSDIYNGNSIITTPLMMDIYYLLDSGLYKEKNFSIENLDNLVQVFKTMGPYLCKTIADNLIENGFDPDGVREQGNIVFAEFVARLLTNHSASNSVYPETEMSWGYQSHMDELEELNEKKPDSVFPFLAVDPRREGIFNLLTKKVSKNGPFYGVKLYTVLGYLPTHPVLWDVYKYCSENDIPITVHSSHLGLSSPLQKIRVENQPEFGSSVETFIQTFDNDQSEELFSEQLLFFGDPKKWEKILEKYPNLRVNFAHFGGESEINRLAENFDVNPGDNWTDSIISLIHDYENVYTDMSFNLTPDTKDNIILILNKYNLIQERLIFGTDYPLIHLGENDLTNKFNFPDQYDVNLIDRLTIINPRNFLSIDALDYNLFQDDFEDGSLNWSTSGWVLNHLWPLSGNHSGRLFGDSTLEKQIDISSYDLEDARVTIGYDIAIFVLENGDYAELQWSADGGNQWNIADTIRKDNDGDEPECYRVRNNGFWHRGRRVDLDLSTISNLDQLSIRFKFYSNANIFNWDYLYVDNVRVIHRSGSEENSISNNSPVYDLVTYDFEDGRVHKAEKWDVDKFPFDGHSSYLNSRTNVTNSISIKDFDDSYTVIDPGRFNFWRWSADEAMLYIEMEIDNQDLDTISNILFHFEGHSQENNYCNIYVKKNNYSDIYNDSAWVEVTSQGITDSDGIVTGTIGNNITDYIDSDNKITWLVGTPSGHSDDLFVDYVKMEVYR